MSLNYTSKNTLKRIYTRLCAIFVKKSDIQDNLTSEDTDKPLSAAMGRELNLRLSKTGTLIRPNTTTEIELDPGRYLVSISQNGAWPYNALGYLDLTKHSGGSYFSWITGNISSLVTVEVSTSSIIFTGSSSLGTNIRPCFTQLHKINF